MKMILPDMGFVVTQFFGHDDSLILCELCLPWISIQGGEGNLR